MKKLGFGLMRLPIKDNKIDIETTKQMVDEFMSKGFTYFDTAYIYHERTSEEAFKTCVVDRYPRESFTITTKLPGHELTCFEDRNKIFEEQLRKTGCSYFDYYWLHAVSKNTLEKFDKYDCWNFIIEKKNKGYIKHIGFSYHDCPELLEELLIKHPEIEYVQLQLNYLDYESENVQSRKCYEVCTKYHKPVIVMEPVRGGNLVKVPDDVEKMFKQVNSSLSIPSWAIRFAASLENVYMVLSGMSNMEQLLDNTSYMEDFKPLNKEEMIMCLKAGEIIRERSFIGCTACRYCVDNCPMSIDIPYFFALYNSARKSENNSLSIKEDYKEYIRSNTAPNACLKCGECEKRCPQHLRIRNLLEKVTEYFGE